VIFITHNPHHAYAVGDRFTILKRGRTFGTFTKDELSREEMVRMMSGADELDALSHELSEFARREAAETARIDKQLAESLEEAEEIFEHDSSSEQKG
jgi:simple sugar transport system ATP-binding protein